MARAPEPLEVEVERLPEREGPGSSAAALGRNPLPPVLAGMAIDLLDIATRGPRMVVVGLVLGAGVGYYLGRRMGLERARSAGLAALCGLYCGTPGTWPIPLGTIFGGYLNLAGLGKRTGRGG